MSNNFKARLDDYKARFERLSARERRMVAALASALVLTIVFGIGYWISASLDEIAENNTAMQKALHDLRQHEGAYIEHRQRVAALEARMSHTPLELNSYVEKAASAVGVTIAESGEITPVSGDTYVVRGVEIKLSKVTIGQLASLLKRIEDEQAHIVQVTRLSANTRWNRNEELDVELVVSTYQRAKQGEPRPRRGGRS